MLGSQEISKEVVQETFLRLWERRSSIDPDKSLKAYVFTIAKNLINDHLTEYARQFEANHELMWISEKHFNSTQYEMTMSEIKQVEAEVLNKLPAQQRNVYKLSRDGNLSHQKISEHLGISINSVKTHLRLALKTLKSRMAHISDIVFFIVVSFFINK